MSLSRQDRIVQFSGSNSVALSAATRVDSDEMEFDPTDTEGSIQIKATTSGTPATGDIVNVWIKWTNDGTNYDTDEHADGPYVLNTYPTDTPGENPAVTSISIRPGEHKGYKLSVAAPQAATRGVTFSAIEQTMRAG